MAGLEGTQLGSCRILHRIGGGGMGDIYLADQPGLGRQVAVKVVRGESAPATSDAARAQAHQQFLQEAQAIATLDHPNILPVYEYGEQQGIHYLVMPYIPSGSLADLLTPGARPDGLSLSLPLAPTMALHIISQTAEALQYAHDHGVIHRDVKPQNLLVRMLRAVDVAATIPPMSGRSYGPSIGTVASTVPPGANTDAESMQILLADFGLARFMALLVGRTGTIGTPLYSAPEQYSGYPVPATDQYALAGIAYLLLTGYYVFNGTVVELHHQHLTVMPTPPTRVNPALPPAVDTMLLRALAKDPAQRFPSVREFARGLHSALTGASVYPAWPQQTATGAPIGTAPTSPASPAPMPPYAPSPAPPSSLMMPTPNVPGISYGPAPQQGMDTPYTRTPGGAGVMGGGFAPAPGVSPAPPSPAMPPMNAPFPPQYGAPPGSPMPTGAPSPYVPQPGAYPGYPAPANTPFDPASPSPGLPGATPAQQRPFVPTAPRGSAPAPYLTPSGPWRADADAPGAALPRRPKSVQVPFRGPIRLTRKVLLISLAAVLVLASLSGLAVHFFTSGGKGATGSQTQRTTLVGASGITGQSLQLSRSGTVTISSLRNLNGTTPRAQSALSARVDLADASVAHIAALPAIPATVPRLADNGSLGANQQIATPRLVLAGAGQPDVGLKAPVDTSVGANGQYVVEALDGLLLVASVSGTPNATRTVDSADVFASVLHSGAVLGEPRVLFEQTSGHWLIVYDEVATQAGAISAGYVDVAASQSSSPLAGWNVYQVRTNISTTGGCTWADYPQIGNDAASYYLTASLFACGARGQFQGTILWEMPQSALTTGSTAALFQWTGFANDHQRPMFSLTPALESDATTTEWLVGNDAGYVDGGGTSRTLYVWAVVHLPAATSGKASGTGTIAVARTSLPVPYAYADPPAAAQRGTSVPLATGDARISSLAYVGGHLYAAFTTAVNWQSDSRTRSGTYWLDLGPTTHVQSGAGQLPALSVGVIQAGIWGFSGGYTMYPALVADSVGNVVLAAGAASSSLNASLIYGSRKKSDPKNVLEEGHAAQLLQRGSKAFTAGQWGDYSGACLLGAGASGPEAVWFAGAYTDSSHAFWRTGLWQLGISS